MKLSEFIRGLVHHYRHTRRFRTAETYLSTSRSMLAYHGSDVSLSEIFSPGWLYGYQHWLLQTGLSRNSVVFYLSRVRSMYNIAVHQEIIPVVADLFMHLRLRSEPTSKRAVDSLTVGLIGCADLRAHPGLSFARDMFMLSFYLQGIPFVDLAHLRKTDIHPNGIIFYQRRKTGARVTVALEPEALEIIARYKDSSVGSPYLLPIIAHPGKNEHRQYASALRTHNRRLKKIAVILGLEEKLTSYVCRHTWATVAYHEGIATSVISQAMGHQSEKVTHIYLKSFDYRALSAANQIVINAVSQSLKVHAQLIATKPMISAERRKKKSNIIFTGSSL